MEEKLSYVVRKYLQFYKKKGYLPNRFNPYNCMEIEELAPSLTTICGGETGSSTVLISNEKGIRKLTVKECFRLQGFPDNLFECAAEVTPEPQLYKQVGNAVTVNIAYTLGLLLKEIEDKNSMKISK